VTVAGRVWWPTVAAPGLACVALLAACGQPSGPESGPQPATLSARAMPSSAATPQSIVTSAPTPARRLPLSGRVVLIDPGHNGGNATHPSVINALVNVLNGSKACDTAGTATAGGYAEHAFAWDVSQRLAALLRAAGATVYLTRVSDTGVGPCITQRAAFGNRVRADAAVSVHADGGPAGGYGFHVIRPLSVGSNAGIVAASSQLATAVVTAMRDGSGQVVSTYLSTRAGVVARDDLGGLNLSAVPKVFIECGNMRNAADASRLASASGRQRIAGALAAGVRGYLIG
jgi:N-acetylmuramoyl-L-alanine amidase